MQVNTKFTMSLSSFQAKLQARLAGGHFRYINERLYTQSGDESFKMMQKSPELFTAYHEGFRKQVKDWPLNPLDLMIKEVQKFPAGTVVADFGCGEAQLAATVMPRIKVHSFDLVAPPGNKYITSCDCSNVPLPDNSVDIAIFCLSLMGTNYQDFLTEANRVLKPNGYLFIAEVRSRFEIADKEDEEDVGQKRNRENISKAPGGSNGVTLFVEAMKDAGFRLLKRDEKNKMFVLIHFQKEPENSDSIGKSKSDKGNSDAQPNPALKRKRGKSHKKSLKMTNDDDVSNSGKSPVQIRAPSLKACIYKRR